MKTALSNRVVPRFRAYHGKEIVLGPGKAELLEHISATGSISEAARLMGMSYNRAWLHVKTMNESFQEPVVNSSRGGTAGGGAELTETGKRALALYKQMEEQAAKATAKTEQELLSLLRG